MNLPYARAGGLPNKGMELSKPEYRGRIWPTRLGIMESGFAAHAPCWTDSFGIERSS
jgi:hypothetical protein